MNKPTRFLNVLAASAVALLSACGGGGATGTSTGSTQVTITTQSTLSMSAAAPSTVLGLVNSFPNGIASANWTAASTNGAAPIVLTNAACASAVKKSQAGSTAGVVSAEWDCTVGVAAPTNLQSAATYSLTLTAADSKGNSSSSTTDVIITPSLDALAAPVATVVLPVHIGSGSTATGTCVGSLGHAATPGVYSYQWTSYASVSLLNANTASVSFVAPAVTVPTSVDLICRVTDDNQRTGTSTQTVIIDPPQATTIVPSVVAGGVASPNATVTLDGSKTGWFNTAGQAVTGTIYYDWVQTRGPAVQMFNTDKALATATMSGPVATDTVFGFTLNTSDLPFVGGVTTGTVNNSAEVVYSMSPNPVLELSTTFASAVASGAYVVLPTTTRATPGTSLPLFYSWTQITGPAIVLGGSTTSTANFGAPVNPKGAGPLILEFRVSVGYAPITVANPGVARLDIVVVVNESPT